MRCRTSRAIVLFPEAELPRVMINAGDGRWFMMNRITKSNSMPHLDTPLCTVPFDAGAALQEWAEQAIVHPGLPAANPP